jgi:hypothetical protein
MDLEPFVRSLQQPEIRVAIGMVFLIFVAWHIPVLRLLLFPFFLFVVFVHEIAHGVAAILTGGEFNRFVVSRDISGVATVVGGAGCVTATVGYLSTALLGGLLLVVAAGNASPRAVLLYEGCGMRDEAAHPASRIPHPCPIRRWIK